MRRSDRVYNWLQGHRVVFITSGAVLILAAVFTATAKYAADKHPWPVQPAVSASAYFGQSRGQGAGKTVLLPVPVTRTAEARRTVTVRPSRSFTAPARRSHATVRARPASSTPAPVYAPTYVTTYAPTVTVTQAPTATPTATPVTPSPSVTSTLTPGMTVIPAPTAVSS